MSAGYRAGGLKKATSADVGAAPRFLSTRRCIRRPRQSGENIIRTSTIVSAAAFVVLWNSGFIGAEYGLPYAGPFTLLFWRYCALSFILALYLLPKGRLAWPGWSTAGPAMVVGILAHGVWLGCVLVSLDTGVPAGIVALVVALQPMATGALSGVVTGETTPLHRWAGLLVGFCGVAITLWARIGTDGSASVFGYLIPFGSALSMTAATLIQRRMEIRGTRHPLPLDMSLFYQSCATALFLAIPAVWFERLATDWTQTFAVTMLWLIGAVSLGAYALLWRLIARIDATRVASLFYFGPPVTMVMAWFAFGDVLRPMDVAGLAIVFTGVLLTQRERRA